MISYYDLLGMVKEGNAPERIEVKLCSEKAKTYIVEYDMGEFNYYRLSYVEIEDENYKYYLSECFLESSMFDKCIKILDEEDKFEDVEELKLDGDFGGDFLINDEGNKCHISSHDKTIVNRINKVIKNQNKIIERLKGLEK